MKRCPKHSHKKQKGSLEGSLDQVLFEAALEFQKNSSTHVNIEWEGNQNNCILYVINPLEHQQGSNKHQYFKSQKNGPKGN